MNALLLIDIQNDFLPGGALAVSHGDEVIAAANRLISGFPLVIASQDWHPAGHGSFASAQGGVPGTLGTLAGLTQVLWPDHCVQGTRGADFAAALDMRRVEAIFRKGVDPTVDSYSAFWDNGRRRSTGLAGYLRERGVSCVTVCGLATDYCVRFTALDAVDAGFEVTLALGACRGVELAAGDVERAVEELRARGVKVMLS
ncbi:MAG: bifunctional nicotinamidase/pyrazinamidase [Myxococcales bacterium]|nr:bifunctional nicotinamidase/pyrazinamidase [Myxococcales bacterium]